MPNSFTFSARSHRNLKGVHPDLVRVMHRAIEITALDFMITEGLRTEKRQRELMAAGASRTMNSRHLTGHAVDVAVLVGREVRWDWPLYAQLAGVIKYAASKENVPIIWGGDWPRFRDGPHYELDRKVYP